MIIKEGRIIVIITIIITTVTIITMLIIMVMIIIKIIRDNIYLGHWSTETHCIYSSIKATKASISRGGSGHNECNK